MAGEGPALAQLSAFPHLSARMMSNMFLKADGSGRSSSPSVRALQTLGPLQLWAVATLLKRGWLVIAGLWSSPCSMGLQSQLLMTVAVACGAGEGQDAATRSHLMEDTSRLDGNLQELCLCLGWPSGRHETEGGRMAYSLAPTVAKAWLVALSG